MTKKETKDRSDIVLARWKRLRQTFSSLKKEGISFGAPLERKWLKRWTQNGETDSSILSYGGHRARVQAFNGRGGVVLVTVNQNRTTKRIYPISVQTHPSLSNPHGCADGVDGRPLWSNQ